jgi:proline iminopeptidase
VRRLVVISTSPGGLSEGPWNWTRILGDLTPREPLKTREEFLRIARRLFVNSLAEPDRANDAFAGAVAKDWAVSIDRFNAMEKEFKTYDLRGKMRHIQAPTLIVAGKLDPVVPLEAAEAIRAEIPKSELVVFERSGHYPMLEEPEKFKSVIEEFLKRD